MEWCGFSNAKHLNCPILSSLCVNFCAPQVELVESAHSVICTVPAARAAVESAKASTFSHTDLHCLDCDVIKCTRHKCNKPELRVINLLSVQPGRLVLVASPKGELIRGTIEVVHGYQKGVVGVGVGYVDERTFFFQHCNILNYFVSDLSICLEAIFVPWLARYKLVFSYSVVWIRLRVQL